jgi:hypothetical protein
VVDERFDLVLGRDFVWIFCQAIDGGDARCGKLFDGRSQGAGPGPASTPAGCFLDVGRVIAFLAIDHLVFSGLGRDHEFVRELPAHYPCVRIHRNGSQAAAAENADVGIIHFLIAALGAFVRNIEAVGILHDKFLGAHEAEPGPNLVTKLGLDLVKVLGELAIRIDLTGHNAGDDLFMSRPEDPFLFGPIPDFEQNIARGFVATAFLPDFGRLQGGHQDFERAGAIHFFSDDLFDFAQGFQAQRKESIKATGEFSNQAGAQKQLVGKDLGIRRGFLQSRNQSL